MITQERPSQAVPPVSTPQALAQQEMTPMFEAANAPVIHVDRLRRTFGKLEAVNDISFDVYPGEIFGFLGPNGAGKSTTINMLCTLLRPTSGSATIAGYDIVQQRVKVRESIGLIFQEPSLDENLTADENLRFHAAVYGLPRSASSAARNCSSWLTSITARIVRCAPFQVG